MGNFQSCTNMVVSKGKKKTTQQQHASVSPVNCVTMDLSKLVLGGRFDGGGTSIICHGWYADVAVAVKIIVCPSSEGLAPRLFDREVSFLCRLHHPNIIRLIASCKNQSGYYILTEYLSGGSLRDFLIKNKKRSQSLPLNNAIGFALDIARGMEYLHSQGVIHRDLKPDNVLIDRDFNLKIADFGTSCLEAQIESCINETAGTLRWMAPEMVSKKPYGRKVDVYSFGLMLWELVAGKIPFEDLEPVRVASAVVNRDLRPVIPQEVSPAMRDLIEECWSKQPDKRPEFSHVVDVLQQLHLQL